MRAARVHNGGEGEILLKRIMSFNMDYMNGGNLDLISCPAGMARSGRWSGSR